MTHTCPSCGKSFPAGKAVCPDCSTTHPDALATTDTDDQGVEDDGTENTYLARIKTINYYVAAFIAVIGYFGLFLRVSGFVGYLTGLVGRETGEFAAPPSAMAQIAEPIGLATTSLLGYLVNLVFHAGYITVIVGLLIGAGYALERGYQLGLWSTLVIYGGFTLVALFTFSSGVVVLLFTGLPLYWLLRGRTAVDFERSLQAEWTELVPDLAREYARLINRYVDQ